MNILLIGGSSSLINNLIIKLNKERHRVYLLTGKHYDDMPYQKVFERYCFTYECTSMTEIFESINPDLTIFMGAYDTNFSWKEEESESIRYSASVLNILMSYAMGNGKRFIYLSSHEVYSQNSLENITEEMPPTPSGYRGMVLAQAEELCETYRKTRNLDIVILRLDHLYGIPEKRADAKTPCARMCLEALEKGYIDVCENSALSMIYETDAIEAIYRVIVKNKCFHGLYNISNPNELSEAKLAELVQQYMGYDVKIVHLREGATRRILSERRYESEFGQLYYCDLPTVVRKIASHMKKNRRVFLFDEDKKENLFKRLMKYINGSIQIAVPFIENFICFIPFFMINNRAVGSRYFSRLDTYLLYVLLFAIMYGQQQATLSAILAVGGYCFRQMYDRTGFEVMLDTNTYLWIAQLFILGLAVGYLRDTITKLRLEQETERGFLTTQVRDIKDINSSNVRVKDALETQIVNQNDSVGKIYNIASTLNKYSPEEVLFYAVEVIGKLVKSEDVAIYVIANSDYARIFSYTSKKAKALGASIRYTELGELYQAIAEKKVYINRALDERYPMMASAIYDENGSMLIIMMVWTMPWESMTLGQANQLVVIGALVRDAVTRANNYLQALEEKRYINNYVLGKNSFLSLASAFVKAERNGLTECTLIRVEYPEEMDGGEVGKMVADRMRQTDYVGEINDGRLYVLLPNTSQEDAHIACARLAELGCEIEVLNDNEEEKFG